MTKVEKVVLEVIVVAGIMFAFSMYTCQKIITDNDGVTNILIEVGKEIKEIKNALKEEN